jgi:hypothetical protein
MHTILVAIVGAMVLATAGVTTLVIAALIAVPSKMISDEVRARIDDLPVLFVRLALMQLPKDMQAYYRPDWEDNALAAFNDQTARFPVTRFARSFLFGFSLLVGARQIRRDTKVVRQLANNEEMERIPPAYAMIGPIQLQLRNRDGKLYRV